MGMRVLLWDTDPSMLELCAGLLSGKGHEVYACDDCEHLEHVLDMVRPWIIVVHGSAMDEDAFKILRHRVPDVPVAYLREESEGYELLTAKEKASSDPTAIERLHSLDEAIQSAIRTRVAAHAKPGYSYEYQPKEERPDDRPPAGSGAARSASGPA